MEVQSRALMLSELLAAKSETEKKMKAAHAAGNVEQYHTLQVQWNNLSAKIRSLKSGAYNHMIAKP